MADTLSAKFKAPPRGAFSLRRGVSQLLGSRWDSKGVGDAEGRRTGVAGRDRIPLRQIKQTGLAPVFLFDGAGLMRTRFGFD